MKGGAKETKVEAKETIKDESKSKRKNKGREGTKEQ
jgi:hypothetical protein